MTRSLFSNIYQRWFKKKGSCEEKVRKIAREKQRKERLTLGDVS